MKMFFYVGLFSCKHDCTQLNPIFFCFQNIGNKQQRKYMYISNEKKAENLLSCVTDSIGIRAFSHLSSRQLQLNAQRREQYVQLLLSENLQTLFRFVVHLKVIKIRQNEVINLCGLFNVTKTSIFNPAFQILYKELLSSIINIHFNAFIK